MGLQVIPKMDPEDLERVLKTLPRPTYAEVSLYGDFDYSDISLQAEKVVSGVKLRSKGGLTFILEDPSKETILDVYRKSREAEDVKPTKETGFSRRIDLHKAEWYLDNHVQIELTPWEINVKYRGKEPNYISQLRQDLSGTRVRLKIEVNR